MLRKWSEREVLRLLELYEKHDCLWNHREEKYKNKTAKENALLAIVKDLEIADLTVAELKYKINIIRGMYKQKLTQILNTLRTNRPYEPKLYWFKRADSFLRDVSLARASKLNLTLVGYEDIEISKKKEDKEKEVAKRTESAVSEPEATTFCAGEQKTKKIRRRSAKFPCKPMTRAQERQIRKLAADNSRSPLSYLSALLNRRIKGIK